MNTCPAIMRTTQIASFDRLPAEACSRLVSFFSAPWRRQRQLMQDGCDLLWSIFWAHTAFFPCIAMMGFHMLGVGGKQFQIFNAVVGCVAIFMVYAFFAGQFSAKVLLHDMAMLKHSLAIDVTGDAPIVSQLRLSFLGVRPIWRYVIVRAVPVISGAVHLTDSTFRLVQNLCATIDSTYLSFSHCVAPENKPS